MGRFQRGAAAGLAALVVMSGGLPGSIAGDDATVVAVESPPAAVDAVSTADDVAVISELLAQVAAQREEIFSARIRYRWTLTPFRRTENTPEHVRAVLDEYDLLGDPDSLGELVQRLVPDPAPAGVPWETRDFLMLGDKRRADTSGNMIQLVDSEHEMVYEGVNSQLRVDHRGKSSVHLTSIEDFRSYPPEGRGGLRAEMFRVVSQDEQQITLEKVLAPGTAEGKLPTRCTFDRATGVMTHYVQYVRGQVDHEIWQQSLTEYPGGIVMPALRVVTRYNEGRLSSLRVFIIEEAEFNGPIPEDKFVMPVSAGTVLVDERFAETRVRRTKGAADDVRSILIPANLPVARVPKGGGPGWRTLLILNGVALIVLATVLWRKASLSPSPPTGTGQGTSESS